MPHVKPGYRTEREERRGQGPRSSSLHTTFWSAGRSPRRSPSRSWPTLRKGRGQKLRAGAQPGHCGPGHPGRRWGCPVEKRARVPYRPGWEQPLPNKPGTSSQDSAGGGRHHPHTATAAPQLPNAGKPPTAKQPPQLTLHNLNAEATCRLPPPPITSGLPRGAHRLYQSALATRTPGTRRLRVWEL